jgi:serine/threonine protein kinase
MSFAIGENVGPYRILEQLGQGGMASVFKAYHAALDRYIAMKVLHPAFKEDPNFISRFQREAKVVARLEHPNIVPVYDYAEHSGSPYLVMKYIEGETLKARLNERSLTKQEAVEIATAVGDGSIYLADFGLARIAQAGASTLSKDVMMGTPQYISPEQAQGNKKLDDGTDIYSMGVVLYELVVGRVPFNADTPFSIIHDHIYTPLPVPSKVNPKVPKHVEKVLLKALSKERESRFESVDDLIKAFRIAVLGGEGADIPGLIDAATQVASTVDDKKEPQTDQIVDASDTGSPPKKRRRWPWVLGGIALTVLCLLAFAIIAGNQEGDSAEPLPDPPLMEDVIDKPPDEEVLEDLSSIDDTRDPHELVQRAKKWEENDRPILAAQAYFRAGELFLLQDNYPDALESLLKSIEVGGLEIERPERAEEIFTRTLFLASAEIPIYEHIERLDHLVPDWPELPIFVARTEIHFGELAAASEIIDEFLEFNPENPLARSVQAEIHIKNGEFEQASRIIEMGLGNARSLPPWLVDHIHWLESEIKS